MLEEYFHKSKYTFVLSCLILYYHLAKPYLLFRPDPVLNVSCSTRFTPAFMAALPPQWPASSPPALSPPNITNSSPGPAPHFPAVPSGE